MSDAYEYVWLTDYADEASPCEPDLSAWAKWISDNEGQEEWRTVPESGEVFDACAMNITGWCRYILEEDGGMWKPVGEMPKGEPFALVEKHGARHWWADDILGPDVNESVADMILMGFQDELDIGHAIWVVYVEHFDGLVATYHGPDVPMSIGFKVVQ